MRGFRIELGEIEAALTEHPAVEVPPRSCARTRPAIVSLVGYVVPAAGRSVDTADVLAVAARALPTYMVPSALVVHRSAAAECQRQARSSGAAGAGLPDCASSARRRLRSRGIVAEVFSRRPRRRPRRPGRRLLRTRRQLADRDAGRGAPRRSARGARCRSGCYSRHPLSKRSPHASRACRHGRCRRWWRWIAPARIPLSLAQQRMWFLNRFDPSSAVNNIVRRHPHGRRSRPRRVAGRDHRPDGPARVAAHRLSRTVAGGPSRSCLRDAQCRSGPHPGPGRRGELLDRPQIVVDRPDSTSPTEVPLRVHVCSVRASSDTEHVLGSWCTTSPPTVGRWRPLARDVMVAYVAARRWEPPAWAPLPVQYADFALWQREVLGSEDDPESLICAADRLLARGARRSARPARPARRPAAAAVAVVSGCDGTVRDPGRRCTLAWSSWPASTVRRCSWWCTARWRFCWRELSGTEDIAIGTPIAGRGDAALDDLIGMFVNTLVLRTESISARRSTSCCAARGRPTCRRSATPMCRSSGSSRS